MAETRSEVRIDSRIIGHEAILRELRALASAPEPPHALLLAGPEGTGRKPLALEYARLLNCEARNPAPTAGAALFDLPPAAAMADRPACGECRPCRLIAQGTHPDVVLLGPGDALCRPRPGESHEKHPLSRDIRICQVRGLIDAVSRYPFEARYRLIVIDPAERLGRDAAHALLKTLEEPPGHTVIVLVTAAPEAIIETILSRCRRIDVRAVARDTIEAGLIARGVEPQLAARAASASRGRPGRAIAFANEPGLMGDRERLLEQCAKYAAARTGERFGHARDLAERHRKDRAAAAAALDAWEAFWEEQLRAAAAGHGSAPPVACLEALRAVGRAREDLLAQVQAQPALELMLLSFPALTLEAAPSPVPSG